ncbi:MAG: PEP-CTERM sorting domain-containing protein [Alphaproteobacteria bacterium]|nr:PEP-CTERM sorting domain-containing protein [Alphaproteobacteria bacterium]
MKKLLPKVFSAVAGAFLFTSQAAINTADAAVVEANFSELVLPVGVAYHGNSVSDDVTNLLVEGGPPGQLFSYGMTSSGGYPSNLFLDQLHGDMTLSWGGYPVKDLSITFLKQVPGSFDAPIFWTDVDGMVSFDTLHFDGPGGPSEVFVDFGFIGTIVDFGFDVAGNGIEIVSWDDDPRTPSSGIPTPGSLALLGIGVAGLAASSRRRKQNTPQPK